MTIQVKSPTRVDLAGGTLDCWPLYSFFGQATTINVSVDIFSYVELIPGSNQKIDISLTDVNYSRNFANLREVLGCEDLEIQLIRYVLEYFQPIQGFALNTRSESPVGGGIGGSSSLMISLIRAFSKFTGLEHKNCEWVTLASNLEARVLKTPTGTQDYVPALSPGLNVIHYGPWGFRYRTLEDDCTDFFDRSFLVYTGVPHHSGLNNWEVIKSCVEGHGKTIAALGKIQQVAQRVEKIIAEKSWPKLVDCFAEELEARKCLSDHFASPEILELNELVLKSGGDAVKICGAGGGGCVLVYCQPSRKEDLIKVCQTEGHQVLRINAAAM